MEDMGQQVRWEPEPILAQESTPLVPLAAVLEEESGATPVQEDGAAAKDDAAA